MGARYRGAWNAVDTLEFLEHCHQVGAAGIQAPIQGDVKAIRERAERNGMYIEAMVDMPMPGETDAFEAELQKAQAVGALALRADCLSTRRYEAFESLEAWRRHVADRQARIETARPLLDRYKIPLGLENHKDFTTDEGVALMERLATEYFGVCLDFGNNLSLLDEPMKVIEKLAPYTVCVHLKDMAVAPCEDGFEMSEVVLGDGYLDLQRAIDVVRACRPEVRCSLEMITRDPLRVRCLEDRYWVSFPDRTGRDLARTLRFVKEHASRKPLPVVSRLSHEDWMQVENENVIQCLRYANEHLQL
jgi:sugar phosphate isomerase/epimerase